MVATILSADLPSGPFRLKGQKKLFLEHGYIAYQIKDNHKNQQHGGKYFANRPHSDPGGWANRPHSDPGGWVNRPYSDPGGWVKIQLSEHGHVAYKKRESRHECNNIVTNILPADPPPHTHTNTHPLPWG